MPAYRRRFQTKTNNRNPNETSGKFTIEAKAFSNGRNIKLIDGTQLFELIRKAKAVRGNSTNAKISIEKPALTTVVDAIPTCPICTKPMVQRTAKKGSSVGNSFWGCSGYPACCGTRHGEKSVFKVLTDWLVRWVITDLWPKQWLRVKVQYTVTMLKQRGAHMVPQSAKKMKPRR